MSSVALTGNDTIIINNRPIIDFADADVGSIDFPNDIANVKTGKNGNALYALNESGKQADVILRIIRGSDDDKFFNSILAQQQADFAGFVLMVGEFIKKVGDGLGNKQSDTYVMSGGVFTKIPPSKSNVEGDTEQSLVLYTMKFSNAPRIIT